MAEEANVQSSDITYEDEDIDEIEKRLRKVEIAAASAESTQLAVGRDIAEIKAFMQKWLTDSARISEIATRVEAIPRLETQMGAALTKYDELFKRVIILEHTHGQCVNDRTTEKLSLNTLINKVNKTETDVNNIGITVRELASSKKKAENILGGWAEKFIFIVMLYLIYLIIIHFSKDNPPGELLNNPPKLKSQIEFLYIPREKSNAGQNQNLVFKS
jgi:hypothetical protein